MSALARWLAMVPDVATGRLEPLPGPDGEPLVIIAEDLATARLFARQRRLPHAAIIVSVLELDEQRRHENGLAQLQRRTMREIIGKGRVAQARNLRADHRQNGAAEPPPGQGSPVARPSSLQRAGRAHTREVEP